MKNQSKSISSKIVSFLGSNTFFYIVIIMFVVQAIWLAISAAYPMLYDEHWHFGYIFEFSDQLSPLIGEQTDEQIAAYGDITRRPSYFYHYLLSFPFRLISEYIDSFKAQLFTMRFINVAFVTVGLIAFRSLFVRLKISKAVVNSGILILTILPITVFVAAHINYDNFLFFITPFFLIYAEKILQSNNLSIRDVCVFLILGLIASLAKYTFLPIFIAATLFLLVQKIRKDSKSIGTKLANGYKKETRANKKYFTLALIILLLVFSALFIERHVYNFAKYNNVFPHCARIHDEDVCSKNYIYRLRTERLNNRSGDNNPKLQSIDQYTLTKWIPGMTKFTSKTASNVGWGNQIENRGQSRTQYGQESQAITTLVTVSLLVFAIFLAYSWNKIRKLPAFYFVLTISLFYTLVVLVYVNYRAYLNTGIAAAVQPRYMLLISPLLIVYSVQAISYAIKSQVIKISVLIAVIIVLSQGGGITAYLISSDGGWYTSNRYIVETNLYLRDLVNKFNYFY